MASRFVPIILAAVGFLFALAVSGWYGGLWERSPQPAVVDAQPARPPIRAAAAVLSDEPPAQPLTPVPAPTSGPSPLADTPALTVDSGAPDEPDARGRRREASRGARTR
jgi:hypothetical protein